MGHGPEERKDYRKKRNKKNRNIEPVHIHKAGRYRQNAEKRSNIRIKHRDQTSERRAQIRENDKDIILRKRGDLRIPIGQVRRKRINE